MDFEDLFFVFSLLFCCCGKRCVPLPWPDPSPAPSDTTVTK